MWSSYRQQRKYVAFGGDYLISRSRLDCHTAYCSYKFAPFIIPNTDWKQIWDPRKCRWPKPSERKSPSWPCWEARPFWTQMAEQRSGCGRRLLMDLPIQGLVFGQNITKSFRIHHLHANSLTVVKVVGENMNSFGVYGMPHILCCLVFRSQLSFKLESHFQKVAIMELVLAMKMAWGSHLCHGTCTNFGYHLVI